MLIPLSDDILDLDVFLALDLSQAEVRLLAEVAGDELLISQFNTGADIHCLVGSQLTGLPPERIKAEKGLRKAIKNMVFGIIYGKGRNGIYEYVVMKIKQIEGENADLTGITRKKVEAAYDKFFQIYKGVARWIEKARADVARLGYSETIFGFQRRIMQDNEERASFWGNQAINSPIQSAAHQLVLIAMALIHMKPVTYKLLQRPTMEVHDALYFFVKLRELQAAYNLAMQLLQKDNVAYAERRFKRKIRVPILAEATAGFCIGSMVDYKGEPIEEFLATWRKKHKEIDSKSWRDSV